MDETTGSAAEHTPVSWAYPPALQAREQLQLHCRREAVRLEEARLAAEALAAGKAEHRPAKPSYERSDHAPRVGFALSGGGIRSATFSLGVFQALARLRLIRRIDYLSTVSGGGYFGGFLGRLISRRGIGVIAGETLLHPEANRLPRTGTLAEDSHRRIKPVDWLRCHGRYLAPNGGGDITSVVAMAIRNWLALMVVWTSFVLMLFVAAQLLRMGVELYAARHADSLLHALPHGLARWLTAASGSAVQVSPYADLALTPALYLAVPAGWGYWLITSRRKTPFHPILGAATVLLICLAGHVLGESQPQLLEWRTGFDTVALLTVITLVSSYWAIRIVGHSAENEGQRHSRARNWYTLGLTRFMMICLLIAGFAAIDSLGQTLYWRWLRDEGRLAAGTSAALALLMPLLVRASQLPLWLSKLGLSTAGRPVQLPVNLLAGLAATVLAGAMLIGLDACSHVLTWVSLTGTETRVLPMHSLEDFKPAGIALGLLLLFAALFGRSWPFLNRSSHHAFYAARLTQAYLGASNPARFPVEGQGRVSDTEDHDDAPPEEYWDQLLENGGPLHLINLTINETATDEARIVLRDRKGIGMAVGPAGLSAGVRHHALHAGDWPPACDEGHRERRRLQADRGVMPVLALRQTPQSYSMFAVRGADESTTTAVERLYPGQWVAISGAAFTTGLGSRTSAGLSMLMGLSNVRLGYWWHSGDRKVVHPQTFFAQLSIFWRWLFPLQNYLRDEFWATFRGSEATRWYLSDGGHFENMGGYELIRRRLPLMVVVDAEADGDYRYEGLSNLVRKARLDFGAEIRFLDQDDRNEVLIDSVQCRFGSLDELRPDGNDGAYSSKYAALARVRYTGSQAGTASQPPDSWLVYLKPTLHCEDPTDVREYRASHPDFPQESTLDQFFDEAQWESYRKLGEVIGGKVFEQTNGADWIFKTGVLKEA